MSGILQAVASFKAAAGGGGGIAVVQEAYSANDSGVASPPNLAFGSNVTSGNRLIVSVIHSYLGCPPSVTDSQGNTYTSRGAQPAIATNKFWWIFDAVAGSSGANTVTVTYGCGSSFSIAALEVSGSTGYDAVAGQNSTSGGTTSPKSTGAITPANNGSLLLAHFRELNTPITFSQDGVFVIKKAWTSGDQNTAFIWYIQATAASIAVTIGSSAPGAGGGGGIVAYKP